LLQCQPALVSVLSFRQFGFLPNHTRSQSYHHCRRQNGGAGGTCNSPVAGFTCTEGNRQSVPGVQYNATVDCRKGGAEIKSSYTQNF